MPDTVVGLFRTRSEAEEALGKLKEAGFGQDQLSVSTPAVRRRGRYGLKVGTGIVIGTLVGALAGAALFGTRAALPLAVTIAVVEWSARRPAPDEPRSTTGPSAAD